MKKLRIAVIGVGHLGRHHARILAGMPGVALVGVADSSAARCADVAGQCGVPAYEDYRTLLPRVDAVSIAVPTCYHFDIAQAFLHAGKSVLVEKPLTANFVQANQLVELARLRGVTLQVGHVERFNPVLNANPHPGVPPRFIEARRVGPYSFRSTDISVVFDLMIHDLDIVHSLVGEMPVQVSATAWSVFGGKEDVAHAQLTFGCGTVATLTASRAAFKPQRVMNVWWPHSHAELDFAAQRTLACVPTSAFFQAGTRLMNPSFQAIAALRETLHKEYFDVAEQDHSGGAELLALELEHFVSCVRDRREPLVNGARARDAIQLAEAVENAARGPASLAQPSSAVAIAA